MKQPTVMEGNGAGQIGSFGPSAGTTNGPVGIWAIEALPYYFLGYWG